MSATASRDIVGTTQLGLDPRNFTNTSKNFTKVTFVVNDGYVTLNPRDLTITAKSYEVTYDGNKHGVTDW